MPKTFVPAAPDEQFEIFWRAYPRKKDKGDARKAWEQTKMIRPLTADLVKAVIVQKSSADWTKEGGRYVPYPASWLRGERWEDCEEIELSGVVNGKMWFETTQGVDAKARELGMAWDDQTETYQQFSRRVRAAASRPVNAALKVVA